MNGQKVVKVFCHEERTEEDFDRLNDELFSVAERANKYANTLMPILMNIGNVLYVVVAIVGGILLLSGHSEPECVRNGTEHQHHRSVFEHDETVLR